MHSIRQPSRQTRKRCVCMHANEEVPLKSSVDEASIASPNWRHEIVRRAAALGMYRDDRDALFDLLGALQVRIVVTK